MIVIVDYDTGNLCSVKNALAHVGAEFVVTADAETIRKAEHVILPGVGEAHTAMQKLRERGLDTVVRSLTQPVLGICIGMQLLCQHSEEGDAQCLGVFDCNVCRLKPSVQHGESLKIPHMGWNTVEPVRKSGLFAHTEGGAYVYYVHSYAAELCRHTIATTCHGAHFSAALQHDNFYGTQFHPEKSGKVGEQILVDFLHI